MIKSLAEIKEQRTYLNTIQAIYNTEVIYTLRLQWRETHIHYIKLRTRQDYPLFISNQTQFQKNQRPQHKTSYNKPDRRENGG